MRTSLYLVAVAAFGVLLAGALVGCAHHGEHPTSMQEHPTEHHEHPGTTHEQEHPSAPEEQEHPSGAEHPTSAAPRAGAFARYEGAARVALAEHPEHPAVPAPKPKPKPLTIEDVADGIEAYIVEDTRLKGGYFLFYDRREEEVLMLNLDKVHRERLAKTAERTFFACCDFVTPEGKLYDLDFWLHQDDEGDLRVSEVMVHKEAGKPRYTWYEEDGIWKRRPAE